MVIISSKKGRDGGFYFEKDIASITIDQILQAVNDSDDNMCILGYGVCSSRKKCILHDKWSIPKKLINSTFEETTLFDLANNIS